MPVAGSLRDLGIPDLLQLLDLSRKTGCLTVRAPAGTDAVVWFDAGHVVLAGVGGPPPAAEELLQRCGRIGEADVAHARWFAERHRGEASTLDVLASAFGIQPREVERVCREHLENVLFELLSWRDGWFSFEDRPAGDIPHPAQVKVSAQSLLMENARRLDEWSRIAEHVPHLGIVPAIAATAGAGQPGLRLEPDQWEVLTLVDGARDLRAIARALSCAPFEVARTLASLITTGLVEVR